MKRWRCDYARKGTTAQGRQKMLLYERGVCAVGVIVDLRGRVSFPVFAARNEKRGSLGRKAGRGLLLPFPCHVAYGWRGWSSCSSAGILVLEALLFFFCRKRGQFSQVITVFCPLLLWSRTRLRPHIINSPQNIYQRG